MLTTFIMTKRKLPGLLLAAFLLNVLTACSTLNENKQAVGEFALDSVISLVTGVHEARGNSSMCNQIKMTCPASQYRETNINGELRCSCRD